jgi:RHS repeat-associated protein
MKPSKALTIKKHEAQLRVYGGYTGHEMLNEFTLINMNARLYDPVAGMMLSPDNVLQEPTNSQNYHKYAYCFNNPLKYNDPTGNFGEIPGSSYGMNSFNPYAGYNSTIQTNSVNIFNTSGSSTFSYQSYSVNINATNGFNNIDYSSSYSSYYVSNYTTETRGFSSSQTVTVNGVVIYSNSQSSRTVTTNYVNVINEAIIRETNNLRQLNNALSKNIVQIGDGMDWGNIGDGLFYGENGLKALSFAAINASTFEGRLASNIAYEVAAAQDLSKFAKGAKNIAYGFGFVGAFSSILEFSYSQHTNADYARLGSAVLLTGITGAAPEFGIPLGIMDTFGWFEGFYNSFNYFEPIHPKVMNTLQFKQ